MTAEIRFAAHRLPPTRFVHRGNPGQITASHQVLERPRALYAGFDAWWQKVCTENRPCFFLEDQRARVRGIAVIAPRSGSLAKLCTFCLMGDEHGTGRPFLDTVCAALARDGFTNLYGTILPEQDDVRSFFLKAGFSFPTPERLEKTLHILPGARRI